MRDATERGSEKMLRREGRLEIEASVSTSEMVWDRIYA